MLTKYEKCDPIKHSAYIGHQPHEKGKLVGKNYQSKSIVVFGLINCH